MDRYPEPRRTINRAKNPHPRYQARRRDRFFGKLEAERVGFSWKGAHSIHNIFPNVPATSTVQTNFESDGFDRRTSASLPRPTRFSAKFPRDCGRVGFAFSKFPAALKSFIYLPAPQNAAARPRRNIIKAGCARIWLRTAGHFRPRDTLFVCRLYFSASWYTDLVRNKLNELTTGLNTPAGNESS